MSRQVEIRRAAEADMLEAFAWYENEQVGLGDRFLQCAEECMERVAERPDSFKIVKAKVRVAEVRWFPYRLYFVAEEHRILVIACIHSSRSMRHVRSRLSS